MRGPHISTGEKRKKGLKRRLMRKLTDAVSRGNYVFYLYIAAAIFLAIIAGRMIINYTMHAE